MAKKDYTDHLCSVDGCSRGVLAKGLCSVHYARSRYKPRQKREERKCEVSGCNEKHEAYGFCAKHLAIVKKAERASRLEEIKCQCCGKWFKPKRASQTHYCSPACKTKHFRESNPDRDKQHRKNEAEKRTPYCKVVLNTCVICGKTFYARRKKQNCSRECELESGRRRSRKLFKSDAKPSPSRCVVCLKTYTAKTAAHSIYCSKRCAKKAHGGHTAYSRAKKYGVYYETVNPIKVFERDGWVCKQCGIETPRSKRGTQEQDSPELDHIFPISRGGAHSYSNTQLLCRKCNSQKGNKVISELHPPGGCY
jgi:hypothetical protein